MLVNPNQMLKNAYHGKYAIPHFNASTGEFVKIILATCEKLNSPVVIGFNEQAIANVGGFNAAANLVSALIKDIDITVPVAIQFNHGADLDRCDRAMEAGFTSVMLDAYNLNMADNLALNQQLVEIAKVKGVSVEAEVSHSRDTGTYDLVKEAVLLGKETGVDAVAPCLGNVEGLLDADINLDFNNLKLIDSNLNMPLVLHGGSGVSDHLIIKAISNGIVKVNFATDLDQAWSSAVRKYLIDDFKVHEYHKISSIGQSAVAEIIKSKILLLGSNNKA